MEWNDTVRIKKDENRIEDEKNDAEAHNEWYTMSKIVPLYQKIYFQATQANEFLWLRWDCDFISNTDFFPNVFFSFY